MLSRTIVTLIYTHSIVNALVEAEPKVIASDLTLSETEAGELYKVKSEYLKFVAEYGKSYASKEHMDERFGIFKDNYDKIQ